LIDKPIDEIAIKAQGIAHIIMRVINEQITVCTVCKMAEAEIYQTTGDYCLNCWQQITEPDIR